MLINPQIDVLDITLINRTIKMLSWRYRYNTPQVGMSALPHQTPGEAVLCSHTSHGIKDELNRLFLPLFGISELNVLWRVHQ